MTEGDSESRGRAQPGQRLVLFLVLTGTFGLQALTMVSGIISARLLGAEGRGVIALVFALSLMMSQLSFGGSLPNAIAKNLAQRHVGGRDGLREIARRRAWLVTLPCLAAAVAMLLLQHHQPPRHLAALVGAAAIMTAQTIVFRVLIGCLQGEADHLVRMAMVGLLPQALFTAVLIGVLISDWDPSALQVLAIFMVTSMLGIAVGFLGLAKPTHQPQDALDETHLWRDTRHAYVSSVRPVDSLGLDRILVGGMLGNLVLGLYTAATAVSNLCSTVGNAFTTVVLPQVAMHHADPVQQRAVIRRWLLLSAGLITLTVAFVEAIVSPAIRLAFGHEFVGAIGVARWLVLADGLMGYRRVLIAVLMGQGRGGTASWIELLATPVMVAGIALSAANDHIIGIGVTMVVTGLLTCVAHGLAVAQPVRPPSTTST